jgi:23S rRNA pseudouridine1911/1915/1917 synthase
LASERHRGHRFVVAEADAGRRLDQVLAANVPGLSRRKARVALDIGGVFVDGARTKVAGRAMRAGQVVVVNVGGALERAEKDVGKAARERDEARLPPFRVVHEDRDLLVVDKPAGLLTAPTPESDRNNLARLLAQRAGSEVFVVHRLDLETSGLLVFARTDEANRALSERFREHDVERAYLAVLRGELEGEHHVVEEPVAGRRALTHVDVLERLAGDPGATFVRCRLFTGRTHQIRLHARHLGHPVLGDRRYGEPTAHDPPRMALHAAVLGFRHPVTAAELRFESPWPEDLAGWLASLRVTREPDA